MKIQSKPLFYTGLLFQIIQLSIFAILGLSLLNWDWVTLKLVKIVLCISILILYNGLSALMIIFGIKEDNMKGGK